MIHITILFELIMNHINPDSHSIGISDSSPSIDVTKGIMNQLNVLEIFCDDKISRIMNSRSRINKSGLLSKCRRLKLDLTIFREDYDPNTKSLRNSENEFIRVTERFDNGVKGLIASLVAFLTAIIILFHNFSLPTQLNMITMITPIGLSIYLLVTSSTRIKMFNNKIEKSHKFIADLKVNVLGKLKQDLYSVETPTISPPVSFNEDDRNFLKNPPPLSDGYIPQESYSPKCSPPLDRPQYNPRFRFGGKTIAIVSTSTNTDSSETDQSIGNVKPIKRRTSDPSVCSI